MSSGKIKLMLMTVANFVVLDVFLSNIFLIGKLRNKKRKE